MGAAETFQADLAPIYDEVADFLSSAPTPEEIVAFRLSDTSERLIGELLEANRTRGLTPTERLMQAIKVRAFAKLDQAKR
jgi:hypothetical protein